MCLPLLGDDVFTSLYDVLGSGLPAFLLLLAAFLLPQSPWCFYCWRRRHKKALEMSSRCHNVSTREQNCALDNQCNIFDPIFLHSKILLQYMCTGSRFFLPKVIFLHILIFCKWIMTSLQIIIPLYFAPFVFLPALTFVCASYLYLYLKLYENVCIFFWHFLVWSS